MVGARWWDAALTQTQWQQPVWLGEKKNGAQTMLGLYPLNVWFS